MSVKQTKRLFLGSGEWLKDSLSSHYNYAIEFAKFVDEISEEQAKQLVGKRVKIYVETE